MIQEHPASRSEETPNSTPHKPVHPDQSKTVSDARAADRAAAAAQEIPDDRRAQLAGFVLDNWDESDGETTCFGVAVDPGLVPDKLVDLLVRIETDTGFDLIADGLGPADIGDLLSQELSTHTAEAAANDWQSEMEAKNAETQRLAESREDYAGLIEKLRTSGKTNVQIVLELADHPSVPEAERVKLAKFAQIIEIADRVPQDAVVIGARIEQIDLARGFPDPVGFARAFVFDNPGSVLPSGVSDATQDAVAEVLGIERPQPNVATGGDMNEIFEKGVGTKTVRNPETGELREEPVFLKPGEDVEIREGQYIGLSDTNAPMMRIVGEHSYTSDLPENPTDADMTKYGMTIQWIARLNDVNMAEIFFPHSVMERGGGHIELNMPDDFIRAQRLSQAFFGAMAGYDGELLDQSDLDRIPHLMQFQNEKGDAVIGDVNPDQMKADYRRQGVLEKDGTLNWERFTAMIEANRSRLWTGERNFTKAA